MAGTETVMGPKGYKKREMAGREPVMTQIENNIVLMGINRV